MPEKPRLVISTGDPAGIGPEVSLKALTDATAAQAAEFILTGDAAWLRQTAQRLGVDARRLVIEQAGERLGGVRPGEVSAAAGRAAAAAVEAAVRLVQDGRADAVVTAPISKEALREAGLSYAGHTEMLAALTRTSEVRMLLTAGRLRVVHVSTHRSLRSAIEAVSEERVYRTITMTHDAGALLGRPTPRIGVAGLNPHAGEGGLFGSEETDSIKPAIARAQEQGVAVEGPLPADTLFYRALHGEFDLAVAMYHDQGHVAVKLLGFDEGVNLTLGLPFLRTSVDHGTAFDIAGKGIARADSMRAAIQLALEIIARRRQAAGPR